ncbi:L-type lectin-domain containing receptor kinase IX.1-like [Euphorbia lathyris]|uniref:L-type lectin-domain containing receptor kinase IX.1-like n=1 Tax=Euphorbia lathyris TaxID=212925 RepID=UPI003313A327
MGTYFCFYLLILVLPSANSISFQKSRFDPSDTSIILEGGAYFYVGAIELNSDSYMCQVGRATYAQKVPLWDSQTAKLSDFSTHFSFFIDVLASPSYGSGLSFFLAPSEFPIPTNSACGFLGLYNLTTINSTNNQIFHIEFDSYSDPGWDPPVEHVGINNGSLSSAIYTRWNASLHSGDPADVWITYNSNAKNLTVSWKYQTTSSLQEKSSLSYIIDLRDVLPEWVTIGFSAASRDFIERHAVQSWEFDSSLDIDEMSHTNDKKNKLTVGLAVSVGGMILVGAIVFGVFCRRKLIRKEKTETKNLTLTTEDLEKGAIPRRFSYTELISATNSFSDNRKLGEGGFGAVYKGYLKGYSAEIAVKKISKGSKQGKKEYVTEVKVISRLRHRNLVKLIGWCHERGEFLLAYEFMPNGSLDSHLFGNKAPLSWGLRYRIATGLASALLYLHEGWEKCVVHRDLKPSNIMLDSSFNVKLGDFGLARLMDHELGPQTTVLAGTLGYLAPEYVTTGRASKESDVYSYGIVALEIVTGRKAANQVEPEHEMSMVEWVWDLYGNGKVMSAIDERLLVHTDLELEVKQAERLMIVGLWCAHPDRNLRPSIRQAINVLEYEAALPNLPNKLPVPLYHISSPTSSVEPLIPDSNLEINSI